MAPRVDSSGAYLMKVEGCYVHYEGEPLGGAYTPLSAVLNKGEIEGATGLTPYDVDTINFLGFTEGFAQDPDYARRHSKQVVEELKTLPPYRPKGGIEIDGF